MATLTLGTAATTTLVAISFGPTFASGNPSVLGTPVLNQLPADLATVDAAILDDLNTNRALPPNFGATAGIVRGLLYVPNRGVLQIRAGDFVGYDAATGWPILVSGRAAAGAGWVHT